MKQKILVAVSGGVDSVVLLDQLVKKYSAAEIVAAHFNHQIREAALRDARFVENLAKHYGVAYAYGQADVPAYAAEHKMSLEDAARQLRYGFLEKAALENGCLQVAVAHHADDQVETIVMRFLRGSGARGLSGMPEQRKLGAVTMIRPLLGVSRAAIELYAKENKLEHVVDETNTDTDILRNKIRHELIPLLKTYNPNLQESLARMSDIFSAEDVYLDDLARQSLETVVTRRSERSVRIDRVAFNDCPLVIQRRMVRLMIEHCQTEVPVGLAYIENFLKNNCTEVLINENGLLEVRKTS
jgi:tRNA(Ile)-lysidine synthase